MSKKALPSSTRGLALRCAPRFAATLVSAFGLLPLNLPGAIVLVCLGLAAALPALFVDRRRLAYELKKLLHS